VAYVFGGYTLAKDHSEVWVPDVYAYHVLEKNYQALTPLCPCQLMTVLRCLIKAVIST